MVFPFGTLLPINAQQVSAWGTLISISQPALGRSFTLEPTLIGSSKLGQGQDQPSQPLTLGHHQVRYARDGSIRPWAAWTDVLDREMRWYEKCPTDHGYPLFTTVTFMDSLYKVQTNRSDSIPAMQNGMGIISYLKYDSFTHHRHKSVLSDAQKMGDYILEQALTPADPGLKYPRFPRSTGHAGAWPQPPDCGSQDDQPYEIQPDKGAIAGYALVELYRATNKGKYRDAALHIARVLASHVRKGDATHSPWPFRADYRTGTPRNEIGGNTSFFLRLFDGLKALGYNEFDETRALTWNWIRTYQIPSAESEGKLFVQFFEDHHNEDNRTAWGPLNLARYLIEGKEAVDPTWQKDAKTLIEFVNRTFTHVRYGITICGEQDEDHDPWGGINTTWGAVLAQYCRATGSPEYKRIAEQALTFALYAVADNGCPRDSLHNPEDGGWQEDAHTDKVHNIVEALIAFPEWGR